MTILNGWREAAKERKLSTDFSCHSERRSCITAMINAGIDRKKINTVLGYAKNSKVIFHYYIKEESDQFIQLSDSENEDKNVTKELKETLIGFWRQRE